MRVFPHIILYKYVCVPRYDEEYLTIITNSKRFDCNTIFKQNTKTKG